MIEITPAIMGPGIYEEYADAPAVIADLRRLPSGRRTMTRPMGADLQEAGAPLHGERIAIWNS